MDQLTKEAVRYLGYGRNAVDDQTRTMIAESFEILQSIAGRKSIYRIFCLEHLGDNRISFGNLEVQSKSLAKNLKGCDKIVVFGATLGIGVDQLIRRTSLTDMAKAVVLQACAAALLEEYCNECQEKIEVQMRKEGYYLRPRFSPGYGDFSIEHQHYITRMIDSAKTIGLTITDSLMMTPTKSVTAVIGLSTSEENCHRQGCEACSKKDCIYRRDII